VFQMIVSLPGARWRTMRLCSSPQQAADFLRAVAAKVGVSPLALTWDCVR
jgi:hypothetical protein